MELLREARSVFVSGNFIASLLVALSFIEHTLVEELQLRGHIKGSPTLGQAISIAMERKVFPADWLMRTKILSLRRNPFTHLKEGNHQHSLGNRIRVEKLHPNTILEADAKDAVELMYRHDPMDRVDELGDASVPFRFDVHAMVFSDNAPALEAKLHSHFATGRLNKINGRKEFFRADLKGIEAIIRENYDAVVEVVHTAPAEQYRESLRLTMPLESEESFAQIELS